MAQQTSTGITASEYFMLSAYQENTYIQLIDGTVVIPEKPTIKHQTIVGNVTVSLMDISQLIGGKVFIILTEVKLDEQNIYEPDVFYIAPSNRGIAEQDEKRIIGAPDLVVEVLSPSTAKYDRHQKFMAYEQHGVREYWIVDPAHDTIEIWTINDDTKFELQGAYSAEDAFRSLVLRSDVSVEDIFKN